MKLIIAETGRPPAGLDATWGTYPDMFGAMLQRAGARFEIETVNVEEGRQLPRPQDADALLVTGSPRGVYEDLPWLAGLENAVRAFAETHRPVVGICFGHQAIAKAFGAPVGKSDKGWGVGVHTYEIVEEMPWAERAPRISCAVSHQDQVQALPDGFRRIAGSAFCPYGSLAHQTLPVLTFQMHPEFDHAFALELMQLRADRIPDERRSLGETTLKNPSDRDVMGQWIADFLTAPQGQHP